MKKLRKSAQAYSKIELYMRLVDGVLSVLSSSLRRSSSIDLQKSSEGYLLPVVIALGLGIGTVSIVTLQTVSQNSSSLSNQYYSQLAKEAAQAGIAAARYCINNTSILQSWNGSNTLTPQTDCSFATISSRSPYVADNSAPSGSAVPFTSTYSVSAPVAKPSGSTTTSIITSTGTVSIKGPGGVTVKNIRETLRSYLVTDTQTTTTGVPAGIKPVSTLTAGPSTACVIAKDPVKVRDWAYCWGDDSNDLLGSGGNYVSNRSTVPVSILTGPSEAQVSTTANPCGTFGKPSCAGAYSSAVNFDGKKIIDISVGIDNHACMVASDLNGNNGRAYCWGENNYGQLGRGSTSSLTDSKIPIAVDTVGGAMGLKNVTAISAGNGFTCAIASGQTYCWGRNDHGQAGSSSATRVYSPYQVSTGEPMQKLAKVYGGATMCGIATSGTGYCWGQSFANQRGDGSVGGSDFHDYDESQCRSGGGAVADVDPAPFDTSIEKAPPSAVQAATKFKSISIIGKDIPDSDENGDFSAYVTGQSSENGRMYYWGGSTSYLYRKWTSGCHGTDNDHVAHAQVDRTYSIVYPSYLYNSTPAANINSVALGFTSGNGYNGYFCAQPAATSNPIYCDTHRTRTVDGQLGDGKSYSCFSTSTCPPNPLQPVTMNFDGDTSPSIGALDTGDAFTCAVANSKVYCWGANDKGQIGNGTTTDAFVPTRSGNSDSSSALTTSATTTTTTIMSTSLKVTF